MSEPAQTPPGPSGIGGWLVLPIVHLGWNGIGIAINAVTGLGEGFGLLPPVKGVPPLPPDINLWLVAISCFETALLFYLVFCLVQFFRQKTQVPRLMTAFYGLLLAVAVGEYFLAHASLPPGASPEALSGPVRTVMGAVIAAAIWIPYFTMSKRVKYTFVR